MTNKEIIFNECLLKGYPYNGENLFTFQEWRQRGYTVKRGEKAFLKCKLWKRVTKTVTCPKTGKDIKENGFILANASLFTIDQVTALEDKKAITA